MGELWSKFMELKGPQNNGETKDKMRS